MEHSKRCLASSLVCAVENARDDEHISPDYFAWLAHDGALARWAVEYLADGTKSCECDYAALPIGEKIGRLLADGWTYDSAAKHVDGTCDLELCTAH